MKLKMFAGLLAIFLLVTVLIAMLFWLYLNLTVQMRSAPSQMQIALPERLQTIMKINNTLHSHAMGQLATQIDVNRKLSLLLQGKYPAQLKFSTVVPVKVRIDYDTTIEINQRLLADVDTDLIYKTQLLPKFPLHLNIPVHFKVPFHLHQDFDLAIQINFSDDVIFDFDELLDLKVQHQFRPRLNLNDDIILTSIATTPAELIQQHQNSRSTVQTTINIPLKTMLRRTP